MYTDAITLCDAFPVRKSGRQKRAFREAVKAMAESLDYPYREEKGSFGLCNVVMGDPEKSKFLVTAHYDTCAGMLIPNLITPCNLLPYILWQIVMLFWMVALPAVIAVPVWLATGNGEVSYLLWYGLFWVNLLLMLLGPANRTNRNDNSSGVATVLEIMRSLPAAQRDKVCFVLFDLEEAGLIGSSAYRKAHKAASEHQLVLNLDCVGDGDHLLMIPTKKLKKRPEIMQSLNKITGIFGEKEIILREKGFSVYPSDQRNFPLGVGICALRKGPLGLYMSRIHTRRDTVLEQTNVNILRSALTSLITCAGK